MAEWFQNIVIYWCVTLSVMQASLDRCVQFSGSACLRGRFIKPWPNSALATTGEGRGLATGKCHISPATAGRHTSPLASFQLDN